MNFERSDAGWLARQAIFAPFRCPSYGDHGEIGVDRLMNATKQIAGDGSRMANPRLTRREALIAAGLVAGGYAVATLLHATAPLGTDVAGNLIAQAALDDPEAPKGGSPDGNLTMAVYTDFRCPACRLAHPAMRRAIAADGKVRLLYKDFPIFGAISKAAAESAIASNFQGLYEPLHDRLMTGPATVNMADIRRSITAIGGDWDRLEADRKAHSAAIEGRLARVANEAFGLGIAGTPSYLVGTVLVIGALDERGFKRVFDDARRKAASR
jgi:protein-disulfide isomerase